MYTCTLHGWESDERQCPLCLYPHIQPIPAVAKFHTKAMKPFNPKKKIEDVDDYIYYAIDIWECFLNTFTKENRLIRDVTEGDVVEDDCAFVYTKRGTRLAKKMRSMLIKIGEAHFPNEDIEIESTFYQEY